jgi:alkanesulfonate monooxygenase SsuD/methylene tetrahydromethanopterin reductase-like flavin-dependent oxidoreductase (luciferase family)
VESMDSLWSEYEKQALQQQLGSSIFGSPSTVKEKLQSFLDHTQADEIMAIAQVFDHQARLRSCEIVADIIKP